MSEELRYAPIDTGSVSRATYQAMAASEFEYRKRCVALEEALQELYDASGTSCEDRALNEAQRKAEAILNRS